MFVDFKQVRALATISQVAEWLMLEMKNNRTQCPANEGDKRELVLTPEKELFYCFGCKRGGDSIELTAHVMGVSQKDAALHIQSRFHGYTPDKRGLPENGLDYLDYGHITVKALGLSPEKAEALGIGWAPRGTMRNRLLIPLRDTSGKLLGYISYGDDGFRLPRNLV